MQEIIFDRIDQRILGFLHDYVRASNLELAQAVSLSPSQCHRRHRGLEQLGVITRYEARLDAGALGLGVVANSPAPSGNCPRCWNVFPSPAISTM